MNLSRLITRIKTNLGLYTLALPFENLEEVLTEIIINVTLPVFSIYCPYYEKYRFDLNSLEQLEKNSNYEVYLLPDIFSQRKLLFGD